MLNINHEVIAEVKSILDKNFSKVHFIRVDGANIYFEYETSSHHNTYSTLIVDMSLVNSIDELDNMIVSEKYYYVGEYDDNEFTVEYVEREYHMGFEFEEARIENYEELKSYKRKKYAVIKA